MPPAGGGLYEPLVFGPAVLESFEQPSADFTSVGARSSPRSASTGRTARTPPSSASLRPRPPSPTSFRTIPSCSAAPSRIEERSYVAPPKLAEGEYFVELTTGIHHYTGLTNLGNVYAFGENLLDQCDTPKNLSKAAHVFACGFQTYTTDENNQLLQKWGHKGYLFGTDKNGADIFQRIVNGSKMTMTIGGVAVLISTFIGIIVGCVAGYFGGKVDIALMRVTEVFAAIPFLPFAMILSSIMSHMPWSENAKIFLLMCILGVLSWTGLARPCARTGAGRARERVRHRRQGDGRQGIQDRLQAHPAQCHFHHYRHPTLDFATCMLTESSLSYLGFGVTPPRPTMG